jgi:peroxiredoxin Q/BCP
VAGVGLDADDRAVEHGDRLAAGPLVGGFVEGEFDAVGASRVGISTDGVDKQARFADSQQFDYPLLSDRDGAVAEMFGVKRGLLGTLLPVKRTTFVIDTDRSVLDVISSELNMDTHADKALATLRSR